LVLLWGGGVGGFPTTHKLRYCGGVQHTPPATRRE
jgi:hypothetical protein